MSTQNNQAAQYEGSISSIKYEIISIWNGNAGEAISMPAARRKYGYNRASAMLRENVCFVYWAVLFGLKIIENGAELLRG